MKGKKRTNNAFVLSSIAARNRMIATKQRDTKPERELQVELEKLELIFSLNVKLDTKTSRRVDLAFIEARVAVFVDGCFWHGCPLHASWPKHNAELWRKKIEATQVRDVDTNLRLAELGWYVIRVWEHEDMRTAAVKIAEVVRAKTGTAQYDN